MGNDRHRDPARLLLPRQPPDRLLDDKGRQARPTSDWPDPFIMNADGSHIDHLTRTNNWEGTAAWGR